MKVKDVCEYLDARYPLEYAEEFDKAIGLSIGDEEMKVDNILLALDLSCDVIKEALEKKCNLIITHHPFLFTPIYKVLYNDYKGELLRLMIENHIALYSMHTNLDVASGGVNDTLAEMLGIDEIKVVNDEVGKNNFLRYGKIKTTTLNELALNVKMIFNLSGVRVVGDLNKKIETIGIVGGSGAHDDDIFKAYKCGCDCYITGEVRLNNSQYANYLNIGLIEINHGVEKYVFYNVKEELLKTFVLNNDYQGEIFITKVDTDDLKFV